LTGGRELGQDTDMTTTTTPAARLLTQSEALKVGSEIAATRGLELLDAVRIAETLTTTQPFLSLSMISMIAESYDTAKTTAPVTTAYVTHPNDELRIQLVRVGSGDKVHVGDSRGTACGAGAWHSEIRVAGATSVKGVRSATTCARCRAIYVG